MLNAIIKSLLGGRPPAMAPVQVAAPAAAPVPPPAPDPLPVDAPATIPDFSGEAPGAPASRFEPPPAASAPASGAPAPAPDIDPAPASLADPAPAPAADPAPAPLPRSPSPVQAGIPAASEPPVWQSVPLSFRPDPSIRHDGDAARAQAIETQRQLWVAAIVGRIGAHAARPGLSTDEAPDTRPDDPRTEAA